MNVTAQQQKEENEQTKKGKRGQEKSKKKRENRRPILKKLCAALLRSFRGQHSEKMKGSAWGNWDPREGQQPFRPNPNGAEDRTTTLRRLLIGAASQRLHRKSRAGVAENSSRYSWQICLTFAVEDLACLGIFCFVSYDLERSRVKSAKVL